MEIRLNEFFQLRPSTKSIYHRAGTFKEYAGRIAGSVTPLKKKGRLARLIAREAHRILGSNLPIQTLENQLQSRPIISYADHHGLLNYQLLYNSNLLYAEIIKKLGLPFMVVFASGSVPMVNVSHPRGFFFKNHKFNFFAERKSKIPLFLFEKKLEPDRTLGIDSFISSYPKNLLSSEEKKFLDHLFFDCLEVEKAAQDYDLISDQFTFLNHKLWKYFFAKEIRDSIPDIIYLQSNRLVIELLIEEITNQRSLISQILFNKDTRSIYIQNFHGIDCCWGDKMGSHLFWGINHKKKIIPLQLDDDANILVGQDFSIELRKDAIVAALNEKRILPTLFLDFLTITFTEGYTALGGFNQIEYLQQMQTAHVKSLSELNAPGKAEEFALRITNGFICGMFPYSFRSGIDHIWHYNSSKGKFNGSLDCGLSGEDMDNVLNLDIQDMISSAVEVMLGISK